MSKFILTSIQEEVLTTKEFESDYLYDVLERFEEFLRGCGYYFEGQLDIVNDQQKEETPIKDESFTVSFNSPIFESPDKGKTVFIRKPGTLEKNPYMKS
jgi:hypothetical protein